MLGACHPAIAPAARVDAPSSPIAPLPAETERRPASIACAYDDRADTKPVEKSVESTTDEKAFQAGIAAVVRRHSDSLRACYQAVLVSKPYPGGNVVTRFAIDRLGKVGASCVESSTLNRPQAETCIVDDILHWEFPAGPAWLFSPWLIVKFPFVFRADGHDRDSGDDR